jgi:hypothetical protein
MHDLVGFQLLELFSRSHLAMIFARCRCEPSFLIDKVPEMLPVEIKDYLGQIFRSVWLK